MQTVPVKNIKIGPKQPLVLIAGPCVVESLRKTCQIARRIKQVAEEVKIPFIFKSSYDKANRLSITSARGPGLEEGLAILKQIKEELKVPLISDVHCRTEVEKAAEVLDIIQIPAFLSRQTDLLVEAAKTGRVLNIKKGQFLSPWDIQSILEKAYRAGNKKVLVCERGTSFGYRNLVVDFRSIPVIQGFGVPVIFDATHSVQLPGGQGNASGGQREFIESLSKAAVAAGCCGIFLEVHPNPDKAPCDGPNMLPLSQLKELLLKLIKIRQVVK